MRRSFLALCLAVLAGWPGIAAARVDIVATTTDLAAIARAVGGDDVTAVSLTSGAADPHFAAAKPSMIRRVFDADLLLSVGAELEVGWLPAVLPAARNPRVLPGRLGHLDLSTAVVLRDAPTGPVSRAMGHVHAAGNPHYWLDPRNGQLIAAAIAARLELMDPDNAAGYRDRLAAFTADLDQRIPVWRDKLAPLAGQPVIAYHESLVYLASAFGFEIVDEVEPLPGVAPTAAHLSGLVATIRDRGVRLLIMEPFYERRSAAFLEDKTGIRAVVIPQSVGALPDVTTYPGLFDAIVAALAEAGAI